MAILTALTVALGVGLGKVGGHLVEEGVVNPALKPLTEKLGKWVTKPHQEKAEGKSLQDIVEKALQDLNLKKAGDDMDQRLFRWGLEQLKAEANTSLREAVAQATLLQTETEPNPALIPPSLLKQWGISRAEGSQELLANFLHSIRVGLEGDRNGSHW